MVKGTVVVRVGLKKVVVVVMVYGLKINYNKRHKQNDIYTPDLTGACNSVRCIGQTCYQIKLLRAKFVISTT